MRPIRSLPILLIATIAGAPAPAAAQNFFEQLFGIGRGSRPPAPQPRGPETPQPGTPLPADPEAPTAEAPKPAPPKPVVLKTPTEDAIIGQELQLNGLAGSLKLERAGGAVSVRLKLPGTKLSQPTESCAVPLAGGNPVPLSSEGRPAGVPRFDAGAAECPLRFEVTEGGLMVSTLGGRVCTFSALDCATTPTGLWGPPAATLIPRSAEFDTARGVADRAVRENYKVLTQRARREDVRPIVTEQAAFSSEREQLCRTYAREGAHGFCHLRFSENRALALAARLGANTAAPATAAVAPRPRRKPAVDGLNPDAAVAD